MPSSTPAPKPEGATYRLNRTAAAAVTECESLLARAGMPGYMDLVRAAARAGMVLDGRDKRTKKADAAKRIADLLEPLRPTTAPTSLARWEAPK